MIRFLAIALLFGVSVAELAETETGAKCTLPFVYHKKTYYHCTKEADTRAWCATGPKDYVPGSGKWAYCCPNPANCHLNCGELGGYRTEKKCRLCKCKLEDPCKNGKSPCGNAKCDVKNGKPVCKCPSNERFDKSSGKCQVINPCLTSNKPCGSASCNFENGKAVCGCPDNHKYNPQTKSCKVVNPCLAASKPCGSASCKFENGKPVCGCKSGYKFDAATKSCKSTLTDKNSNCHQWAYDGQCKVNPDYMLVNCAKSCNQCKIGAMDCSIKRCGYYASYGDCNKFKNMWTYCKSTCEGYRAAGSYRDTNSACHQWAYDGQCKVNPRYMLPYCAKSCYLCKIGAMNCSIKRCAYYASYGDCNKFKNMWVYCKSTCQARAGKK